MVEVRVEKVLERPGFARIVVAPAAEPTAAPGIIFRREGYQEPNLGRRGWQVREEQLAPAEIIGSPNGLALLVGPQVTRHLDPAPYLFEIPSLRIHEHIFWPDGIDVFDGDLPPEVRHEEEPDADGGVSQSQPTSRGEESATSGKDDPKNERAMHVAPAVAPAAHTTSWTRRLAHSGAGLLLLLVILAVASWFVFPDLRSRLIAEWFGPIVHPTPQKPPAAPAESGKAESGKADSGKADSGPVWPDGTDSLSPVEVVQRAPSGEAVYAVAQRRMRAGRYEDALVLFEQAAERGSAVASTALARMYDPNGFEPGKPFHNPDSRTAASYYKEAVAHGDRDAAPLREALRQRLEKEAREGNGTATTALKDFWP
jgi:hypothetical protein